MSLHSEIDRLLDWCRVRCTAASDAAIKQVFYQVAFEFFNDTSCWLSTVQFETIPDYQSYSLIPQAPGQVIRLVGVADANNVPWAASMPLGVVVVPNQIPLTLNPLPAMPGTIQLVNNPTTEQTLFATFVMNVALPTDGNDIPEMPDWVLPLYNTVFMDGTCGYLMNQQKKPFTDLSNALYHLRKYRDGIARARASALRQNTQGTQSWVFPQSYRVGGQRGGVSSGNGRTF